MSRGPLCPEASPANIAPWARAELVFSQEFEEFNDYILNNADRLVKEMPKEAEEEELDIVDEALFLLPTEDDNQATACMDLLLFPSCLHSFSLFFSFCLVSRQSQQVVLPWDQEVPGSISLRCP
ncbi:hypothetical protein DUNSADRAFT_615 [Dunaliella salina]|uniref:Encoded protein n=1 Tax=Dunaliella salina TaxID=3046 RepID=A0ABQ7FYS8_DUNSA|nr:hypothetical protein DUNSADRAFT_615 [Dunaliella salina]|eukprot:KAF5827464.1 hypothetical protein DUNSADRAFT_615 [Dunaliella salina]